MADHLDNQAVELQTIIAFARVTSRIYDDLSREHHARQLASSVQTGPRVPNEWTHTVELASKGDTEAARVILREFVQAVALTGARDWPIPLPWPAVEYIAEAFRKILDDDADSARALGLKAPTAGRPIGSKTHAVKLAAAYWLLVRRGHSPENANELVREATGADRTTIQRAAKACSAFGDYTTGFDYELLVAIVSDHPALVNVIGRPPV